MHGTTLKTKFSDGLAKLIDYGVNNHLLEREDIVYSANRLAHHYELEADYILKKTTGCNVVFSDFMDSLLDTMYEMDLFFPNTVNKRDIIEGELINHLLSKPSDLIKKFLDKEDDSVELATNFYHDFSIATNYIKMNRIKKNLYWKTTTDYGELEITINRSKPEKDPRDIASNKPKSTYPKCVICKEHVGNGLAPRAMHRMIPVSLDGENYHWQYSPYAYYNEHLIVICDEHKPMQITGSTVDRLLSFVDRFPHYFIGSNADLPYVGGSILQHEHYQGGNHRFAMEDAKILNSNEVNNVLIEQLIWPLNVFKLSSTSKTKVAKLAKKYISYWRNFTNSKYKSENNTVTPIVRKENDKYIIYITIRNNEISDKYPLGLYHVKEDHHHIKKENIGLIEVMGLAVLPARLSDEITEIHKYLNNESNEMPNLHKSWADDLKLKGISSLEDIKHEVGVKFMKALEDCKVIDDSDCWRIFNEIS